jgi:hypothetical protein
VLRKAINKRLLTVSTALLMLRLVSHIIGVINKTVLTVNKCYSIVRCRVCKLNHFVLLQQYQTTFRLDKPERVTYCTELHTADKNVTNIQYVKLLLLTEK